MSHGPWDWKPLVKKGELDWKDSLDDMAREISLVRSRLWVNVGADCPAKWVNKTMSDQISQGRGGFQVISHEYRFTIT